jgi:ribosomal protein S18 acetylase RimI-like enzyme
MMRQEDLYFTVAAAGDAEKIHNVMETVYDALDDKSLYVCDSLEYVKAHIENEGFIITAREPEGHIVAGLIVRYPKAAEDNLGADIGLTPQERDKVVHMESAFVLPDYRGVHLQLKMLEYAEKLVDKKEFKYFLATVSPDNAASCVSFERAGYRLVTTKEKYGGLMRRIYLKT